MGRNKIEIQYIKDDRMRQITFDKRKYGLLKKACELAVLCEIKIVLAFTDLNGNLYNFMAPDGRALENKQNSQTCRKVYNLIPDDYPHFGKQKFDLFQKDIGSQYHDGFDQIISEFGANVVQLIKEDSQPIYSYQTDFECDIEQDSEFSQSIIPSYDHISLKTKKLQQRTKRMQIQQNKLDLLKQKYQDSPQDRSPHKFSKFKSKPICDESKQQIIPSQI